MLSHYLTITLRVLWKNKGYSLLNILSLTVGITCVILIGLYIQDELNYDRFHEKADRIYRVINGTNAKTPAAIGPGLQEVSPEVSDHVWMMPSTGTWLMRFEDRKFYEHLVYRVNTTLLDVFTLPLIRGNPETALEKQHSVIISETIARKYFDDGDPIGKVIDADNGYMQLTVTGVMRDMPTNSHLPADFFVSDDRWGNSWGLQNFYTYILLSEGSLAAQFEQKLSSFIKQHSPGNMENTFDLKLQRLTDIHLYSHLENEPGVNSDVIYIYIFGAIGLVLLLIACINFMNLATARSASRAREVGMRKVVGANRQQLIKQFLGESILLSFIALVLAVALVSLLLPSFNAITGKQLTLSTFDPWVIVTALTGIMLFVGLLSGSYPALFLSAFRPITVLKGHTQGSSFFTSLLRRGLVVIQFTMAIVLMVGAGILYQQMSYIRNARLGVSAEQVLVLPSGMSGLVETYTAMKETLLQHPGVLGVTSANTMPARSGGRGQLPSHSVRSLIVNAPEPVNMPVMEVGWDFTQTLGLELVAGRAFSIAYPTDFSEAVLVNETATRRLGWASPDRAIDKQVQLAGLRERATIVGVVGDFHMSSFHQRIEPLIMVMGETNLAGYYAAVRISTDHLAENLAFVEQTWNTFMPAFPFTYTFLDEDFAQLYRTEEKLSRIFSVFTAIALAIACLGLLGLVSFTAERRTKEIGVRKVLGASEFQLIRIITKEYVLLILLANLFAWPTAYIIMDRWLRSFVYQIDISIGIFLLAGIAALCIALGTVSYHAIKTASANPIDSLRYE